MLVSHIKEAHDGGMICVFITSHAHNKTTHCEEKLVESMKQLSPRPSGWNHPIKTGILSQTCISCIFIFNTPREYV